MTTSDTRSDTQPEQAPGNDLRAMLGRLSKSWGWFAFFGALSIVAGVLALVWPRRTVVVLAVLFGIQLTFGGIFRLVSAIAFDDASGGTRAMLAVLGLLGLFVGLYSLRHVLVTVVILGMLLGIYWVIDGVTSLFAAIDHAGMPGRGLMIVSGVLGIIAGGIMLVWPDISIATLAFVAGFWLIAFGALQLGIAMNVRKLRTL